MRHDSYIIKAWQYFTQDTQEPLFRCLAGFYAACYYKETGQDKDDLHTLLETAEYAYIHQQYAIAGKLYLRLGNYFKDHYTGKKAMGYFKKALQMYQDLGNKPRANASNFVIL